MTYHPSHTYPPAQIHSTLQTSLPLQSPPNPRKLLHHIPNLHPPLTNLQGDFLAALEADRHHGLLCRVARQLCHFDVDVCGAGGRGCAGGAEEREKEAAGSGGVGEGVEGCAEGGDCVDWDGHFGGCGCDVCGWLRRVRGLVVDREEMEVRFDYVLY